MRILTEQKQTIITSFRITDGACELSNYSEELEYKNDYTSTLKNDEEKLKEIDESFIANGDKYAENIQPLVDVIDCLEKQL
jgi:hypothetical protein